MPFARARMASSGGAPPIDHLKQSESQYREALALAEGHFFKLDSVAQQIQIFLDLGFFSGREPRRRSVGAIYHMAREKEHAIVASARGFSDPYALRQNGDGPPGAPGAEAPGRRLGWRVPGLIAGQPLRRGTGANHGRVG